MNHTLIFPASPAVTSGYQTSVTPGGAIMRGADHVAPWSFDTAR